MSSRHAPRPDGRCGAVCCLLYIRLRDCKGQDRAFRWDPNKLLPTAGASRARACACWCSEHWMRGPAHQGSWLTAVALRTEGRIEPSDGRLMCSYHGWRFQGDGKCTSVPQALDEKVNAAACASSRSCASSRPTQVTCLSCPPGHGVACQLVTLSCTCGSCRSQAAI